LPAEIFRRTNVLFENVGKLERLALSGINESSQGPDDKGSSRAGLVLRTLSDFDARSICGAVIYGAGVQEFNRGRVLEKKFLKDSLSGKVEDARQKQLFFEPSITLEKKSPNKFRTFGDCSCALSEEGSLCAHIAALMVAWVKRPEDFTESKSTKFEFEIAKHSVASSLDQLVSCIEEVRSTASEDFEVLQRTYGKLRIWAGEIKDAKNHPSSSKESRLAIHELSLTVNRISFGIISAIENKYNTRTATELYNKNTVSTFGRILETFAQSPAFRKLPAKSNRGKRKMPATASEKPQSSTTRSWDTLIEDFAGR